MYKGGKYIGHGTYGCTFHPRLSCKGNNDIKTEALGKVFHSKNEFKNEIEINKFIKQVDPKHVFTVPYYDNCTVDENKIKPEDEADKCPFMNKPNLNLGQMMYKYGGLDLLKLIPMIPYYGIKTDDLIIMLLPILRGLQKFAAKKYVHCDIKPANILYDPTTKSLRLIDFGLLTKNKDLVNRHNILGFKYPYYPLEFLVLYVKTFNIKVDIKNAFLTNFDPFSDDFYHDLFYICDENYITDFLTKSNNQSRSEFINLFESQYFSKVDVYSLGITLIEIVDKARNLLDVRNQDFVDEFLESILHYMVMFDVTKRFGPKEAADKLEALIKKHNEAVKANITGAKVKKIKVLESPSSPDRFDFVQCMCKQCIEIKDILKSYKLPKSGKKQVLCERLMTKFYPDGYSIDPLGRCLVENKVEDLKKKLRIKKLKVSGVKKELCERLESAPQ